MEASWQSRGQNAKGCAESMFGPFQPLSLLYFDLGPLSQASTLVPMQFIHHAVARATFLNDKHAIMWLRNSQRLPEILL